MSQSNIDIAKFSINSQYAPGLATYGMEGKKGDIGISGNFVYLTDMLKDELEVAISNGLFPMKGKNEKLPVNRVYAANDIFIMYTGEIYKLDNLMNLVYSGLINTNSRKIFMSNGNDNVINTSTGIIIDVTDYSAHDTDKDSKAALQIYNNKYDNDQIQFVKLYGVDNNITLRLNIYYDINTDAFYFDSDKPIIFNNGINANTTNYDVIDGKYYPLITFGDNEYMSISQFNLIALKIKYSFTDKDEVNKTNDIVLHIGNAKDDLAKIAKSYIITGDNMDSIRDEVYLKLYLSTNETYLLPLKDSLYTTKKDLKIPLKIDEQNKNVASNYDINSDTIIMASLLYNTEIVIRYDDTYKIE